MPWQYDWEGEVPLWYGLRSDHIDWRYTGWDGAPNSTVTMDYVGDHGDKAEFLAFFMEQVRCGGCFTLYCGDHCGKAECLAFFMAHRIGMTH